MGDTEVRGKAARTAPTLPSPALFDPRAAWRDLAAPVRDALGPWLLVLLVGQAGAAVGAEPGQAYEAAVGEALAHLEQAARGALPELFESSSPPSPDLAALGVRSCRRCRCTDFIGCPEGCSWVAPDLCSTCGGSEDPAGGRPERGGA